MSPRTEIPTIETDRLRLRAPEMRDFDAFADFRASDRAAFVGGPFDRATSLDSFASLLGYWDLRGYGRWIVADASTDAPLGVSGIFHPDDWPEAEIAWSLFNGATGKGYATEAAKAVRDYAYDVLGWPSIVSMIDAANTASIRVAQRLGAIREGAHETRYGTLDMWRHVSPEARL